MHCDSLSFEWFVDGLPFVVDSGTRTYELGPERLASRGTAAHNTLEIDGQEQHQIWAAFRVARRSAVRAKHEGEAIEAALVPWHDGRVRVARRFEPATAGIRILDRVEGTGRHRVTSRLHLHPECQVIRDGSRLQLRREGVAARISISDGSLDLLGPDVTGSACCESFGIARPNLTLVVSFQGELPWTCSCGGIPAGATTGSTSAMKSTSTGP